jgi:trigger factor
VSIKPEITLKDYNDIRVPRPQTEIGDPDVDEAVERLRNRYAELHAVERPVQAGDFLTVDTHIVKSGAVLIGESQTDAQLEVDKERLIPGLAEGLIGQAQGETRDIRLTLPADYPKKDLAGSDVVFRVTVKSVKERRLPPADELPQLMAPSEAAPGAPARQTLEELRHDIREELQDAASRGDEQRFENDVLKALDERMEVEVPEALIEREVNRRVRELEVRLEEQGLKMERYLQYTNTSLDVLQAEQRPQAVQKVRLELALETVAEREGLTVSDAEVEEAVTNALAEEDHTGHQHGDLRGADPVRAYFRHQLLMRKTVDFLSAVASPESSDTMEPPSDAKELEGAGKSASRGERQTKGKKPR